MDQQKPQPNDEPDDEFNEGVQLPRGKRCPYCKHTNLPDANICHYCSKRPILWRAEFRMFIVLLVLLALLGVALLMLPGGESR